ncbi:DUF5804 family protein [Natronorarus salvus]|uniref:DUF5804 family protein n=1 Tax=Natronorarus salvus TaxID=3117733 RepID=UPI002F26B112
MTTVCLVGSPDSDLKIELLGRETSREALASYEISTPWRNTVAVETVSLGAAVSLCNDLNWYLVRFADHAMIREPSVSTDEWLSRRLARAVRDEEVRPEESKERLAIFGVEEGELVEPMYVTRRDPLPEYDLREVEETLVVRVHESEFGG